MTACSCLRSSAGPVPHSGEHALQGLASLKAVGIAKLQHCTLVIVPQVEGPGPGVLQLPVFVLTEGFSC